MPPPGAATPMWSRVLPRLVTDARTAARTAEGPGRRVACAVLADVYALVQHEVVWASEAELTWTAADRAMSAAQDADTPEALAGAAWTLGMVQRSAGDTEAALRLAAEAAGLLEPRLEDGADDRAGLAGALEVHAAATCARAGREGDAWRHWDKAAAIAGRLPTGYHHPWTMFGTANVALHAVSLNADLSHSAEAPRPGRGGSTPTTVSPAGNWQRSGWEVEIARSYHQRRDYPGMLHWLGQAWQTSADSVRYSPTARQMAAEAVDHGGQLIRRRSHALAASLGLPL